jgi:hypothetical protein
MEFLPIFIRNEVGALLAKRTAKMINWESLFSEDEEDFFAQEELEQHILSSLALFQKHQKKMDRMWSERRLALSRPHSVFDFFEESNELHDRVRKIFNTFEGK